MEEEIEKLTSTIQEKIGEENSALISEELVSILSKTKNSLQELSESKSQIKKLQNEKDNLIDVNGKLFQQITVGTKPNVKTEDEKSKNFNFKSIFDEKGNFLN